jgi:hypothetical protein
MNNEDGEKLKDMPKASLREKLKVVINVQICQCANGIKSSRYAVMPF